MRWCAPAIPISPTIGNGPETWEFQALLKARPAVGDAELAQRYMDALMPMVWTACDREDFVSEVQAMRRRVESLVPVDVRDRELKVGPGGLRDVEFAVQLLQLVHGRTDSSLHVASTVDALAALGTGGYVGRDDAANLTASYEFLRLLEHRLQLQRLKRTHLLPPPDDDEAMRWLAGPHTCGRTAPRCAWGAAGGAQTPERAGVQTARQAVLPTASGSVGSSLGFAPGLSPVAAERQLAALGYEGPQSALTHLSVLVNSSGRRGRVQAVLLPRLLDWLSDTPIRTADCWPTGGSVRP